MNHEHQPARLTPKPTASARPTSQALVSLADLMSDLRELTATLDRALHMAEDTIRNAAQETNS